MSRPPRVLSSTGLYHVIFRGINHLNIFEETEDYKKMLEIFSKLKEKENIEIYAYCLMTNHVHIFIKEKEVGDIKKVMHKLLTTYVVWFNRKYQRSGSLIGNRYKSEPIEDEKYYFALVRYIHQNPVKAGMHRRIGSYKWSSYADYKSESVEPVDTRLAIDIAGYSGLMEFMAEYNEDECLDDRETVVPMTPQQTERMFAELAGVALEDFADLPMSKQKDVVKKSVAAGMTDANSEAANGRARLGRWGNRNIGRYVPPWPAWKLALH